MQDFFTSHPLYIPFLVLNAYVIYKVIKDLLPNDQQNDDDDNGGIHVHDEPILDLPPGVTLSTPTKDLVLNE